MIATSPDTPPITFLANAYSVHVRIWLDALAKCGLPVRVETCASANAEEALACDVEHLTPQWLKRPSALRYLWAGMKERLRRRSPGQIVHAHCTSGYGMVAWMSGDPYIVTTYGSEVLAAADRGPLYQWLIHQVLKNADRITATSPHMVDVLTNDHDIPRERIHLFDLGMNTDVFHPGSAEQHRSFRRQHGISRDEPVWISVKRAMPMNRTAEIVRAFEGYADSNDEGHLIVICGDAVSDYSLEVQEIAAASPHSERITILTEWMTPETVAQWLQIADFAISVPTSDQMSNAVLEAMACGCIPMLLEIEGYRSLIDRHADVEWIDECTVRTLRLLMRSTSQLPCEARDARQSAAVDFIARHYSGREIAKVLGELYDLPLTNQQAARPAA